MCITCKAHYNLFYYSIIYRSVYNTIMLGWTWLDGNELWLFSRQSLPVEYLLQSTVPSQFLFGALSSGTTHNLNKMLFYEIEFLSYSIMNIFYRQMSCKITRKLCSCTFNIGRSYFFNFWKGCKASLYDLDQVTDISCTIV